MKKRRRPFFTEGAAAQGEEKSFNEPLIAIEAVKYHKLHLCIFAVLSLQLFVFAPVEFIHRVLAVIICIAVLLNLKNLKFVFNRPLELFIFFAGSLYLTFAFFGYDLFLAGTLEPARLRDVIYPDMPGPPLWVNIDLDPNLPASSRGIGFLRLLYFGLGFIWVSYVLQSALHLFKFLGKTGQFNLLKNTGNTGGRDYWLKWLLLFSVMFALFMIWQRAFNPAATIMPDSFEHLNGWRFDRYFSHRAPLYSFFLTLILNFAPTMPEVQWIVFAKISAFSALLAAILMYFHNKGIRFKYIILFSVILPLLPSFGLHPLAILPDLANGLSILWLTYVLVRILDEVIINSTAGKNQRISFYIQLCISMVLVFFMRQNSFPVFLVMSPALALLFITKKQWKFLASVAISVLLVIMIRFPGYSALNVRFIEPTFLQAVNPHFFAGIHDIQAAYYAGGNLSGRTLSLLRQHVENLDDPEIVFVPDYVQFGTYGFDLRELTTGSFILMYLDTFVRNPGKMAASMMYRNRAYWVIDPKGHINSVNFTAISSMGAWGEFNAASIGIVRQRNFLTVFMNEYMQFMNKSIPATFIWRFGFWSALMVISVMTLLLQKKYFWLLAYLPVFVYFITLLLTAVATDFRYGLPVLFVGMFLPPLIILLTPSEEPDVN